MDKLSDGDIKEIERSCHRYKQATIGVQAEHDSCVKDLLRLIASHRTLQTAYDALQAKVEAVRDFIGVKYDERTQTFVSGKPPYLSAGRTEQEALIAAVDALRLATETLEEKFADSQAKLTAVEAERDRFKKEWKETTQFFFEACDQLTALKQVDKDSKDRITALEEALRGLHSAVEFVWSKGMIRITDHHDQAACDMLKSRKDAAKQALAPERGGG